MATAEPDRKKLYVRGAVTNTLGLLTLFGISCIREGLWLYVAIALGLQYAVFAYADTYVPEPPHCAYRLRVPASCVAYVSEAQGSDCATARTPYQPRVCRTCRVPCGAPQVFALHGLPHRSEKYYDLSGSFTHLAVVAASLFETRARTPRQQLLSLGSAVWMTRLALLTSRSDAGRSATGEPPGRRLGHGQRLAQAHLGSASPCLVASPTTGASAPSCTFGSSRTVYP